VGFLATTLRRLFASSSERQLLPLGSRAPDFEVQDHLGNWIRLADLRGGRVVLWFFPRANTRHCTAQGCAFRDRIHEFESQSARVLGVSFDSPAENRRFAEEHGFTFPLLCDVDRRLAVLYCAASSAKDDFPRRVTYVIGPDGLIEQALETKDPAGQAGSLLETLR